LYYNEVMANKINKIKIKLRNKKFYIGIIFVLIILLTGIIFYKQENQKQAKILVVGDMMFDRHIREVGNNKGEDFIFSCKDSKGEVLSDFLKNADLVVGNLEGPITENTSVSMFTTPGSDGNYTFTFPTNTAELLVKNNIKLVNLGNNHIDNFGEEGITSTKKYLSEAGVDYFGLPSNRESLVDEEEINGQKISFINYNEFGNIPVGDVIQKVKDEKQKGQLVIIYAHWGDWAWLPQSCGKVESGPRGRG